MTTHTPTPWAVDPHTYWIVATNAPKGPMHVADIRGWGYLTGKGHGALGLRDDEALSIQKANAELIVKAVNAHAGMVKAIQQIEQLSDNCVNAERYTAADALTDLSGIRNIIKGLLR